MTYDENDAVLIKLARRGDKDAFGQLFSKYRYRVMKLLSRYLRDSQEIHDVTQEVFIKAYRAFGEFRQDAAFYTWLYRITVNTAKNHIVSNDKRLNETSLSIIDLDSIDNNYSLRDIDSPEHQLLKEELETTIYQAIETLPEELQVALVLRELQGLSYDDIAEVMGCPVGTVRSRLFRAREFVDKEIAHLIQNP